MDLKDKAIVFWQKFSTLKDKLMDIDSLTDDEADEILQKLDAYLKEYSEGVDFVLSDLNEQGRDINFTALGDENFFEDVIALVENCPIMDFWSCSAFSKAQGKHCSIEYENIRLQSKDLFFLPMESEEINDKIGLKIAGKGLIKNDNTLTAAYLLCEKMIGEYNSTTLIDYFDIEKLPTAYEKEGFLPLDYLPDFTEWKIEKTEKQ